MHSQTSSVDALAGVQHIPLSYVIATIQCQQSNNSSTLSHWVSTFHHWPLVLLNKQELLIACSLHTHPLFCDDSPMCWRCITRLKRPQSNMLHPSNHFNWEALVTQHARQDKWGMLKSRSTLAAFLVTYKWKKGSGRLTSFLRISVPNTGWQHMNN